MQGTKPCKFFLQGHCRFGANCWYQHAQGQTQVQQNRFGNTSGVQSSGFPGGKNDRFHYSANQNMFSPFSSQPTPGAVIGRQGFSNSGNASNDQTSAAMIVLVKKEMQAWQPSKMWPLSCFSYAREQPCLSGLTDYSPEELRIAAYAARKSNTFQQYLTGITQLGAQSNSRKQELQLLTPMAWQAELQKIAQTSPSFGGQQNQLLGAQPTQQGGSSLFVPAAAAAGTANPFANAGQSLGSNLFGAQRAAASPSPAVPSGLFKPASFGSSQAFPSLFGGSSNNAQQQKPFGAQPITAFGQQPTPAFGSQPVFQQPSQGFGLTQQSTASTGGLFGQPKASVFGSTAAPSPSAQNPFQKANPFASQSQVSVLTQQQPTASSVPSNPFLVKSQPTQSAASGPLNLAKLTGILSHISFEPTAEDIAAFKTSSFTLGAIPERPPPLEMC